MSSTTTVRVSVCVYRIDRMENFVAKNRQIGILTNVRAAGDRQKSDAKPLENAEGQGKGPHTLCP